MNIRKWIVEEVDEETGAVVFRQEYTDEEEANQMYTYLKEKTDTNLVTLSRSGMRLLNEDV